jgi:transglutaminase-like putative cysteine protease
MRIRAGCEITYDCPQPTPTLLMLRVHPSRARDLERPDDLVTIPSLAVDYYHDSFGNLCGRTTFPTGRTTVTIDTVVADSGLPDPVVPDAIQHRIPDLPSECLVYLLGSRYCETDRMSETAWSLFGNGPEGWGRVQAICDYVHEHVKFGYEHARSTKSASDVHIERAGVCRDFAHLAVTFCRWINIPARYVHGYLGDIGGPRDPAPMDYSAWFEAYLGGRWYAFDARHNTLRIGRIVIGIGRDASDVPISNSFGNTTLAGFRVWTDEISA